MLFVGVSSAAAPAFAAPDRCAPAVQVSGDADVANDVRARLARRTRTGAPETECPALRAHVERRGDLLQIAITDGYGRRSEREVRDTATAVALIESWTQPEIAEVAALEPPPPAPVAETPSPAVAPAAAAIGTGLALWTGASYAADGSTWMHGALAGCVVAGPVCVGGRVELAHDTGWTSSIDHARIAASAAATAELPLRVGGFTLAPGVGIGVGWGRIGNVGPHLDETANVASLRVLARVALLRAVGARWAIGVELAGDGAVLAQDPVTPETAARLGVGLHFHPGGR